MSFLKRCSFFNRSLVKIMSTTATAQAEATVDKQDEKLETPKEESNGLPKYLRKAKYDGRSKKRKWEERRSDWDTKREKIQDNSEEATGEKVRRRKFAMLLGYSGANYYGMQRNPKTKTIEEDLFQALLKANLITEDMFNQVQQMQFQRAARTDKGVSACRQVVSLKLPENTNIADINAYLPETIRVFGIRRVTKGFNSKSQCDSRTYAYLLPTVAFAHYKDTVKQEEYKLSDVDFKRVNEVLGKFVGTKNFHNYTIKKAHNDPSANRYMMSFICEPPFVRDGVEFAILKVRGQSFMMHQIRKMVGITLAVIRGHTDEATFDKTFLPERVNVPKAPSLGLLLDFVHYDRYNVRYGTDHATLEWQDEDETVRAFYEKYIYTNIIETELKEKQMVEYVDKLWRHRYDTFDEWNEEDQKDAVDVDDDVEDESKNDDK